jgi:hypothetical protein
MRQREAAILLAASEWARAYYLIGYAVECALKACIARQFTLHSVPDRRLVLDFYTHDVEKLLGLTQLRTNLLADAQRQLNWAIVKDWSEQARYEPAISSLQAQDLYAACTKRKDGILPWLRKHW